MFRRCLLASVVLILCAGCDREEAASSSTPQEILPPEATAAVEATQPAVPDAVTPAEPSAAPAQQTGETETPTGFQGVRNGWFESEPFNIRFQWPASWQVTSGPTDDSITIQGPDGLQMIVAGTQSFQLVDTNLEQINDRLSFENVNIIPDRTETRPINGMPGYRVEGDALLRGENVPIYFVSQAISIPGAPVVATIFIPGESYFLHSDEMKAVLDSIEALNLRPE
ncbi:MAG: hypothetical protein JW797_12860 [Bradymonadales bacterium]|nr:hypothetical protein [Bradymonadales bacterium]